MPAAAASPGRCSSTSMRFGCPSAVMRASGQARASARSAGVASKVSPMRQTLMTRMSLGAAPESNSGKVVPAEDMVATLDMHQAEAGSLHRGDRFFGFLQAMRRNAVVELHQQLATAGEQSAPGEIGQHVVLR